MLNTQVANTYKNQQIMTASPAQLTLLLYNGALRFLNESIAAVENQDILKSHTSNMRVQDIVRELACTLDMSYEISKPWAQLYEYVEYCLIQGNIKKDIQPLMNAKMVLQELREAWEGAMKQVSVTKAANK